MNIHLFWMFKRGSRFQKILGFFVRELFNSSLLSVHNHIVQFVEIFFVEVVEVLCDRLVFGLNRFFFLFSFNDFLFHDVGAKIHKVLIILRSKFLSRKGLYNIMFFSIDIHDKFYFFFIELTPILVKCGDS